jgi:hypothetical protein
MLCGRRYKSYEKARKRIERKEMYEGNPANQKNVFPQICGFAELICGPPTSAKLLLSVLKIKEEKRNTKCFINKEHLSVILHNMNRN